MITKQTKKKLAAGAALFAISLMPTIAAAQEFSDMKKVFNKSDDLTLSAQGSFFIGGSTHYVDDAYTGTSSGRQGNSMINQMYVQFQIPKKQNKLPPIVFVHGCCLSSKTWETTPDGREGWYEYFTRQGFATYMADQVGRARSGFDALEYNRVKAGADPATAQGSVLIATDKFAWDVFRFGDFATKAAWPDEKFPMQTVAPGGSLTFYKQVIPDMTQTLGSFGPNAADYRPTPASMATLAQDLKGAILVGHSQSSSFPTRAALQNPKGVKGIIQLETGCFANLTKQDVKKLKKIPILIMVGDHFSTAQPTPDCVTEQQQINDAGGDFTFISLPDAGLKGNSHMFMQDKNNLKVADLIIDWIKKHVKN